MDTANGTELNKIDPFNNCSQFVELKNFEVGSCTGFDDQYRMITAVDAKEWKATPWSCEWTNGRRAYISLKSPHNCIWWDNKFRHWWIGACEKRGYNFGYSFLESDEICPHHGKKGNWKRSESSEIFRNGEVNEMTIRDLPLGSKFDI